MRRRMGIENELVLGASLLLSALLLAACGQGQRVVTAQAAVHVAHQQERFAFYQAMSERCLAEHREDREAYRRCMAPSYHVARAADAYRSGLYAAQALLDAGEQDAFSEMLPDLARAAGLLVDALRAAGAPVPEAVVDIARLGGAP